jgi:hypothetical protein
MTVLICVEKRSVGTDGSNTEAGLGPDGISKVEQPKTLTKISCRKTCTVCFFFFKFAPVQHKIATIQHEAVQKQHDTPAFPRRNVVRRTKQH